MALTAPPTVRGVAASVVAPVPERLPVQGAHYPGLLWLLTSPSFWTS